MAQHFVDPLDQPLGDDVLQLLGVVVDLVPAHTHDLHEKEFDQPVSPQDEARQLLARSRQADAAVGSYGRAPTPPVPSPWWWRSPGSR